MTNRDNDPDETEGRRLYRIRADSLARAQQFIGRRTVSIVDDLEDMLPGQRETKPIADRDSQETGGSPEARWQKGRQAR